MEDIKRVVKLEGLKKIAKEFDKPPDQKPKRESRLKSKRKSIKSEDEKNTPLDSTKIDQKDDIETSANVDKDTKHENDNVERLSKKEDNVSNDPLEDDVINLRSKKSDKSISSESRDTSVETRGKKPKKTESIFFNKKEIEVHPMEDVKNITQDRKQITSPILEEELEVYTFSINKGLFSNLSKSDI